MNNFKNRHLLLSTESATTVEYTIDRLQQVIQINLSNYTGSIDENAVKLTLPDLSSNPEIGYDWKLMVVDSSADSSGKTVEIIPNPSGSDTIDGNSSYVHTFDDANTDAFFVEYAESNLWTIINSSSGVVEGGGSCIMEYSLGGYTSSGEMQFVAGTSSALLFGMNYDASNNSNWKQWLSSFDSFSVKIKDKNGDTPAYSAFNINNVIHTDDGFNDGNLLGFIDQSTFTYGGLFNSTDTYCVDITPSDLTNEVICYDSSTIIDFEVGATSISIVSPVGLGLSASDAQVVIYDTDEPTNLISVDVDSYIEDYDTMSATISGTIIANSGSGTASELCFIPQSGGSESGFLYEKTLFVDPNGNDDLAAELLIGGSKNQPFKTIQAAMEYAVSNYSYMHRVNVHVFAGVYTVSNINPITFPVGRPHTNLHLDDGVVIKDFGSSDSQNTSYDDRGYLIKMQGLCSITGQGIIELIGTNNIHLDAILIDVQTQEADICLKRINMSGSNIDGGYAIYYKPQNGKATIAKFDGEIKVNYNNNGLLLTNADSAVDDGYFVFSDNCIFHVNISGTLSNSLITSYDSSENGLGTGECTVFFRGKCNVYASQTTGSITVINIDENTTSGSSALNCVFDGFECAVSTAESGTQTHYLINSTTLDNMTFSTLNKSTTNCYLDQGSINFSNETMGVLALGVSNIRLPKLA